MCAVARHSTGLKALGYTFSRSYGELGFLALALGIVCFNREPNEYNVRIATLYICKIQLIIFSTSPCILMSSAYCVSLHSPTLPRRLQTKKCILQSLLLFGKNIAVNNSYLQSSKQTQLCKYFLSKHKSVRCNSALFLVGGRLLQ